jgi:transposase-like protein
MANPSRQTRRNANRRYWTDEDHARIYVALQANEGHVAKTAREVGIPYETVKKEVAKWKRQNDGFPPDAVMQIVHGVRDDFVVRMEVARSAALGRLSEIIPNMSNAQQAATVVAILDDKIARAKNVRIPEPAPAPQGMEEIQGQVGEWLIEAVAKAAQRRVDTIESTAVEQAPSKALVVVTEQEKHG